MTFLRPWWLLLLVPLLPTVIVIARSGRAVVSPRQNAIATSVRVLGVTLLVAALAQPVLTGATGTTSVLFLLDRSASVDAAALQEQEAYLAAALAAADPEDLAAVAVFGRDIRLDAALAAGRVATPIRATVDGTSTDISTALRGAAAVLPSEGSRRIVVITDAVETAGDARTSARELSRQGIAVDVVVLQTSQGSDALIESVGAPAVVREGDVIPVGVVVSATQAGPAELVLTAGGEPIRLQVDLQPGRNVIEVDVPAAGSGVVRIGAEVIAGFDRRPENNRGEALVRVLGPAQVALVEGVPGEADDLRRALEAGGVDADVLSGVPGEDRLLEYDAVVLVNVRAPEPDVAEALASYVEELGRGLIVIGGDRAYGLGDYHDTALEAVLPVNSNPDDLIRRQPIAQILVIDTSGSMADCHCDGVNDHDPSLQGGINKTDISRAGAALAIGALEDTDRIGVLAFTSGTSWALPLGLKGSQADIAGALGSLSPAGDTEIGNALLVALEELKAAPEELKHMVLFTDGWGEESRLLDIAGQIADSGITLSVLGTGEGTGDTLRRMAGIGGGRFYRGTNLEAIPEIFVEETLTAARSLVSEGSFLPALAAPSQITAGLTASPPLRGYVLTSRKPAATVALEIGPGDPLLAVWQRGLGRAAAWTSDSTVRWSADWVTWDGFVDFWGRIVRDVLPPGRETPPEVRLTSSGISITFDAGEVPLDAIGTAQVRTPGGGMVVVPLQRVDATTFTGTTPLREPGAYWVAVRVEMPGTVVASGSGGVVAGYAEEFTFADPDPALAPDLASITGGRVSPAAVAAFDPAPVRGDAQRSIWPFLAALALGLFVLDIALRRLVVARGDLGRWKEALTPAAKEPVAALDTSEPVADQPADEARREALPEEETLGQLLRRKRK